MLISRQAPKTKVNGDLLISDHSKFWSIFWIVSDIWRLSEEIFQNDEMKQQTGTQNVRSVFWRNGGRIPLLFVGLAVEIIMFLQSQHESDKIDSKDPLKITFQVFDQCFDQPSGNDSGCFELICTELSASIHHFHHALISEILSLSTCNHLL